MRFTTTAVLTALACSSSVLGGPLAYGLCQTGCNTVTVACYAAAGFQFGTVVVATVGVPLAASLIACNAAQGV